MAITFITGVPRSGKTYFSVYEIWLMYRNEVPQKSNYKIIDFFKQYWNFYITPLPPKKYYETTYLNINEFNFDFSPRLKKLDFDDLLYKLKILHNLNVNEKQPDSVLIEEAKKLGLYNCLIVLDESAHYLTKPVDEVIVWWFTYHGHIHQDLHFISQHVDQIPSDYLKNGEFFYKVYPPSKAIFQNKFSLGLYSCIKFYKTCKTQDITIPFVQAVGDLYISGKKAPRKSILKKYIYIFIAVLMFLAFSIYNMMDFQDQVIKDNIQEDNTTQVTKIIQKSKSSSSSSSQKDKNVSNNNEVTFFDDLETLAFVKFNCIKDICSSKNYKKVPFDFLLLVLKNSDKFYLNEKVVNYNYKSYSVLLNKETRDFLARSFTIETTENKNKKKNNFNMFGEKKQ